MVDLGQRDGRALVRSWFVNLPFVSGGDCKGREFAFVPAGMKDFANPN